MDDIKFSISEAGKNMRPPKHIQKRITEILPALNQQLIRKGECPVSERGVMLAIMEQGIPDFSRRLKDRYGIDL